MHQAEDQVSFEAEGELLSVDLARPVLFQLDTGYWLNIDQVRSVRGGEDDGVPYLTIYMAGQQHPHTTIDPEVITRFFQEFDLR